MFKSSKISLIIRGILFTALGLVCFFFPASTMEVFAQIVGIVIAITGIVFFILEYKSAARSLETMRISASLLLVALGVLIVCNPKIVAILLGAFILFEGFDFTFNTIKYYRAGAKGWWLMLLFGVLVTGLGIWCAFFVPEDAFKLMGILFGCALLGIGFASFTCIGGLQLVEDYIEAKIKAAEEKDETFVEAEVVK